VLKGQQFQDEDEIEVNTETKLKAITLEEIQLCFQNGKTAFTIRSLSTQF